MIKVEKNFEDIPEILKSPNRKEAFDQNINAQKFIDNKNLYRVDSVKNKLKKIYHNKCAYCEKDISDEPQHIEHYRPKNHYYWLAYSWDNLLFCCARCNTKKSNNFATEKQKLAYCDEKFENIHTLGNHYDTLENPLIINPEKDDILEEIVFYKDGKIDSKNERVKHTIEVACGLNRDELVQNRMKIVNDFLNTLEGYFLLFQNKRDISVFKPLIRNFMDNCKQENEYFTFRRYVINNIDIFIENKNLVKIVNQNKLSSSDSFKTNLPEIDINDDEIPF